MNFHCSVTGRKGAREKERREMERESREGAYTRGRVWPGLPGPASCQRHRQSAPGSAWKGWDRGGGDRIGGVRLGLGTLELKTTRAGKGYLRLS